MLTIEVSKNIKKYCLKGRFLRIYRKMKMMIILHPIKKFITTFFPSLFLLVSLSVEARDSTLKHHTILETGGKLLYGVSAERGFLLSTDGGDNWEQRNRGLPKRMVYPFEQDRIKSITSLCFDPRNPERVALTTAYGLFLSEDYGDTWQTIPLADPVKSTSYFTSVALSPHSVDTILLGTSFSGAFITRNRGKSWSTVTEKMEPIYMGAGFYQDILSASFSSELPDIVYIECGFTEKIYRIDTRSGKYSDVTELSSETALFSSGVSLSELDFDFPAEENRSADKGDEDSSTEENITTTHFQKGERLKIASDKYAIYLNSKSAGSGMLEDYLDFLKSHNFNALVVDMKDDHGMLTYDSGLDLPRAIGAVREDIDLDAFIEKCRQKGIYVIGRIVVFKDRNLYFYDAGKYAVWDKKRNAPWGHRIKIEEEESTEIRYEQREFWVDPYSPFVWEYNTAIAKELQDRGIDEIQFDYIRFPSDGDLNSVEYRHGRDGMTKIEAIESFLAFVRKHIEIPISVDLYGFNAWYRMGNWIGQSITTMAKYADVICPMFYPSHFPRPFLETVPYLERARRIYKEGTERASVLAGGRSLIRPFVQAFLIGGELEFEEEKYTQYLINQLEGATDASSSGFTLWNSSNRYYMVTRSLVDYTNGRSK